MNIRSLLESALGMVIVYQQLILVIRFLEGRSRFIFAIGSRVDLKSLLAKGVSKLSFLSSNTKEMALIV